ncbi:MAG: LysM peptidoglycan-binding domain-containing protein [Nocardiaceae bacterium]|nr:LysM peptidoglycan-binding domain-containing protein [Nocardiaceae bacterium]
MTDALQVGQSLKSGDSITSGNGSITLTLQPDGNLVLATLGKPTWASQTDGKATVRATLQEDGNFVAYTADDQPVWASQTGGQPARSLTVLDDGNLVLTGTDNSRLWATNTATVEVAPRPVETPPEPRSYTVEDGDTLWAIAEKFYGDGGRYPEIAAASGIDNPDVINVGQVVTIP